MKKLLLLFLLLFPLTVSGLSVSGETAILMDQDSGRILYAKNIRREKLIASITKIMTAVIAIESNQLDDVVDIDESILKAYGSNIYIQIGEKITLRDLVYGLMLRSGNDAALAISTYLSGSEEKFVNKMNDKAAKIGMKQTIFYNPHGLDEKNENISTAYDMAILTKYANQIEEYRKIVGTKKHVVKTNLKTYVWSNKNKLLFTYEYTTGGKTGYTEKARRTLVSTASKDNMNLIVVTLNDPNDWQTHKDLYEYGFNNYHNYLVLDREKFSISSDYYKEKLYIKNNCYYPLNENETDSITVKIKLEKIKRYEDGDQVGTAEIHFKEKKVHEELVYIKKDKTKKKSFWQRLWEWLRS